MIIITKEKKKKKNTGNCATNHTNTLRMGFLAKLHHSNGRVRVYKNSTDSHSSLMCLFYRIIRIKSTPAQTRVHAEYFCHKLLQ